MQYNKKLGINYKGNRSHKNITFFDKDEIFCKNSLKTNSLVKRIILLQNLIKYECSECKLQPNWNNKKLVLELHHINGIRNDNTLENLTFLCPNCHSQTPTFNGRGINGKQKVSDSDLINKLREFKNIGKVLRFYNLTVSKNYDRLVKLQIRENIELDSKRNHNTFSRKEYYHHKHKL